ncbi:MAG: hypothetical protein GX950_03505 [Candidatus Diapherotrites archaeon]|uniref:Uncharacterized protein n=1 Tax=Candidatus Iainarchaeum sp. TaxID=3101447 RepID=A0A7K4C029_9ARCH|nr:hypothetical protein [Candidatus Diapherotrites archaeon]
MDFFVLTNLFPIILFFGELFGDLTFILKIFVLMAIFSYVMNHVGKGALGIFIFALISWLVIFDYFAIFGSIYILHILLTMGLISVIIDFMFITPGPAPKAPGMGEPVGSGKDFTTRLGGPPLLR